MNNRKLTEEEIEQLFDFCDEFVVHYDIQIELVDHIASAIEERWEKQPTKSFNDALTDIYTQMGGAWELNKISNAKEKELKRKYNRFLFNYIKSFFKIPKIILTIALTVFFYMVYTHTADKNLFKGITQIAFLLVIGSYWWLILRKKVNLPIETNHTFLLFEQFKSYQKMLISFGGMSMGMVSIIMDIRSIEKLQYMNPPLIISFLLSFFILLIVAMGIYMPLRIKEDFEKEFPQFIKN